MKFTPPILSSISSHLSKYRNTTGPSTLLPAELRSRDDYAERATRKAAVLIPLVNVDGVASVLFTLRAANLNTHPGQVAFPGGHLDGLNETSEDAAVRELKEETGLVARPIGMWKAVRAITGTMVTPIVGFVDGDMTAEQVARCALVQPDEVEAAFALPVKHLLDPMNREIEQLRSFRTYRFR